MEITKLERSLLLPEEQRIFDKLDRRCYLITDFLREFPRKLIGGMYPLHFRFHPHISQDMVFHRLLTDVLRRPGMIWGVWDNELEEILTKFNHKKHCNVFKDRMPIVEGLDAYNQKLLQVLCYKRPKDFGYDWVCNYYGMLKNQILWEEVNTYIWKDVSAARQIVEAKIKDSALNDYLTWASLAVVWRVSHFGLQETQKSHKKLFRDKGYALPSMVLAESLRLLGVEPNEFYYVNDGPTFDRIQYPEAREYWNNIKNNPVIHYLGTYFQQRVGVV